MSSHPHSKKFPKDNNFWLSEKHCCCNCNYKFRMPILRLHSIFPILESLYGRIPSLICIEIINLKNHSWQVSWNVKADIIIIIMVTYRHAVPRKKKNRFQFKCYSETKIFGHAKSQQHQDQSLYYPEGLHVFFSVSNLAFGFVLWQIWCSYYLEREWILLICIFETRTSMPYLAMYICICCLLGCQKKYQDKTRCAKINKSIHLPRPI